MRSGDVALDGDCREGGKFAFSAIRLKLAFSKIFYYTFNVFKVGEYMMPIQTLKG